MLGELVGDTVEVALDADADHGLAGEADLERIGDRDDLHDPRVEQPLDPLAHGGLGQADGLADRGVRPAAVLLELLDDRLGDVVEQAVGVSGRVEPRWHHDRVVTAMASESVARKHNFSRIPLSDAGSSEQKGCGIGVVMSSLSRDLDAARSEIRRGARCEPTASLANFVGGKAVESSAGRTLDLRRPEHRGGVRHRARLGRTRRRPRHACGGGGLRDLAGHHAVAAAAGAAADRRRDRGARRRARRLRSRRTPASRSR